MKINIKTTLVLLTTMALSNNMFGLHLFDSDEDNDSLVSVGNSGSILSIGGRKRHSERNSQNQNTKNQQNSRKAKTERQRQLNQRDRRNQRSQQY